MRSLSSTSGTLVLMIVSHSHWDREWHMPFQQFRIKLGKMIDSLLDILASSPDFRFFMLDGQTILLEDYAELRPERLEELQAHIRAGRILVGPWYVLPDEFLVSGEALIRNLLIGRDIANAFGGCMEVGYLPDQFGHISQMPQILSSFGIRSAVLWRGVSDDVAESTEFTWQSPDGTGVLAINIRFGYFNAGGLPAEPDELADRINSIVDSLAPQANTRFLLLMNGGDHVWPQPVLPAIVSTIKSRFPHLDVRHSSLPAYVDAVERSLAEKGVQLEVVVGELRCCKAAHLLPGVMSTRMWIKQRNAACENLLEKWVEPFTTWAWIEATRDPGADRNDNKLAGEADTCLPHKNNWRMPLQLAWKYLLQNQPHDSVCGCSVDQVHDEMRVRYDWVEQIGETLIEESLQEISERIDTSFVDAGDLRRVGNAEGACGIVVYNPTAGTRTDLVTFEADSWSGELLAIDSAGNGAPCQVLANLGNGKLKWGFVARDVPGIGYKTYRLHLKKYPEQTKSQDRKAKLENEFYIVTVNQADGTIDVLDRETGQIYRGLNRFSDVGDAGDQYNFDRPVEDSAPIEPTSPSEVKLIEVGPARFSLEIQSALRIPRQLSPDRKRRSAEQVLCPVTTVVSVYPGVRRIDFTAQVENLAEDHRLRVLFPTGVRSDHFYTESQFDVLKREVSAVIPQPEWIEDPVAEQPQKSFVDVSDGNRGLLIANRGLPECEVSPGPGGLIVGLTLLRCVGWLSRGDLCSRRGDAGPSIPTPGGQCPGTHRFDYAVIPHNGSWLSISRHAHEFNNPFRSVTVKGHSGHLPTQLSFLSVIPEWIPVSAVKPANDASGAIVRLYNPTSSPTWVRLASYVPVARAEVVDFNEHRVNQQYIMRGQRAEGFPTATDALHLELQPKKIVTVKLYYW